MGISYAQIPSIRENYKINVQGGDNDKFAFEKSNIGDSTDEKTEFANSVSLLYTDKSTIVQSELINDYMGKVRLSFGTVVSATSNESTSEEGELDKDAEQELLRIANGGGNFYLMGQLPIYARTGETFLFYPAINAKVSADIDGMGSNVNASDVRGTLYASLYASKASNEKQFNFFINAEYGLMLATNDFNDRFGIEPEFKKPVLMGRAMFGVTIGGSLRFVVTTKAFSNYSQLINDKITVGLQILSDN
ncbi:MAG: hypothetical protein BM557_00915 [Flavobacterium sp. MedPE-SWcel]|nr:MAG: hypothetical protein BM557_00915 [Flavobacterium sp. MedPE-SWcel]